MSTEARSSNVQASVARSSSRVEAATWTRPGIPDGSLGRDHGAWHWVVGRSDPREQLVLLYHDERGVCRVFDMTFGDGEWTLTREDPDFHQRFIATVGDGRIEGRWEASEDAGATWRKDFDLIFERQR